MGEVVSLIVGFVLGHIPGWFDRKRRIKTHWHSLRAEALLIQRQARAFLAADIMAPLYRFPVVAAERAFPVLIAEGALTEAELLTLSRFVSVVQELNRGLEEAAAWVKASDPERLRKAHGRNLLKAEGLLEPRNDDPALVVETLRIVDAKISQPIWKY